MEHSVTFLQDLAVVMIVGGIATLLFHKLRQPVVLGYMLAGFVIGPHTPPFALISDEATVRTLAELGVVLLMFRMGLHFSLRKLFEVGPTALIAASFEIIAMIVIGYFIGQAFGWGRMDSIFLGAILSISSTTIIVKALIDLKMIEENFAKLIFGILIVEDLLAIALLAMLSSFAMSGSLEIATVGEVGLRLMAFLASVLVLGLVLVPRLLRYVAGFRDSEMLLVVVLGLCFGLSLLAVQFGYSVALGAFLIGAIMAETREAGLIEKAIAPVRDMFSAVFFVAVGMLIDPNLLVAYAVPILVITVAVIAGKILTCAGGAFLAGNDPRTSMKVGMGLAQIGEFSFIIAQLGTTLKVTSGFVYPIAVMVSVLTTITTPYLIKSSDWFVLLLSRVTPKKIADAGSVYQGWLERLRARDGATDHEFQRLRHTCAFFVLNLLLIAAVFFTAAGSTNVLSRGQPLIPAMLGGVRGAVWLLAGICALPLLIAAVRNLSTIGDIVAKRSVSENCSNGAQRKLALIHNSILLTGCIFLFAWVLVLGAAILPDARPLLYLLIVLALVAYLARRMLTGFYHSVRDALVETLRTDKGAVHSGGHDLPSMIFDTELSHLQINSSDFAAGKLIRELHLRSRTGVFIAVIARGSERLVSPGPDDELKAGDVVLLIGDDAGLERAKELLRSSESVR